MSQNANYEILTMNEQEFKSAIQNILMLQQNTDRNLQILQSQIDGLQRQLDSMKEFRDLFKIPKEENQNREPFEFYDEDK